MLPQATADHYREQQRLTVTTLAATRRAWSAMGDDFDASWRRVGGRLLTVAEAAQLASVQQGVDYLPRVLAETNQADDPVGEVRVGTLVGESADGRTLEGLLYGAVTESKRAVAGSAAPSEALARGGRWLEMAVASMVADAARDAVGLGIAARPQIGGYVRMLNLPSCSRCAVLAGKWFRYNAGFPRHPRCDCRHIPSSEDRAGDFRTDPRKAVESGQVRGLSAADRRAIEDGADVAQVINAQRGMRTVRMAQRDLKVTLEGTTRRGRAGRQLIAEGARLQGVAAETVTRRGREGLVLREVTRQRVRIPRLRPETIYAEAKDRDDAIRLLRRFGYIT